LRKDGQPAYHVPRSILLDRDLILILAQGKVSPLTARVRILFAKSRAARDDAGVKSESARRLPRRRSNRHLTDGSCGQLPESLRCSTGSYPRCIARNNILGKHKDLQHVGRAPFSPCRIPSTCGPMTFQFTRPGT